MTTTSTPWRLGHGWSEAELRACLTEMTSRPVNFDVPVEQMTSEHGWIVDGVTDIIAREAPGPPVADGPFARAREALIHYDFSDPRIVEGHFDPTAPLPGRTMLLEMKVLGGLRFLGGVRVHSVRDEQTSDCTRFGFRYDTLVGHFERGFEWFLIEKQHTTGTVCCQVEAHWQPGDFPTWWSRLGFRLLGGHIREFWRRRTIARLRRLARQPATAPSPAAGLVHRGAAWPERTD
jgi:uncharacterized protein (UPF0548 family)